MCTQETKHNTQNKTRQAILPPAGTNNSTGFFKTSAGIGTLPNLCCDMLGKHRLVKQAMTAAVIK